MDRKFELEVHMDEHTYNVTLTINGRAFVGDCRQGDTAFDVYRQITSDIKAVYGRALFENIIGHRDILQHMDHVWEIIKQLHSMCRFA